MPRCRPDGDVEVDSFQFMNEFATSVMLIVFLIVGSAASFLRLWSTAFVASEYFGLIAYVPFYIHVAVGVSAFHPISVVSGVDMKGVS